MTESPWVRDDDGQIIEVVEHAKPKELTYRVRLDDGTETSARAEHLRPAYADLVPGFKFEIGERVHTPLGEGEVQQRASTPLGRLYRVDVDGGDGTRDCFEQELMPLHAYASAR